MTVGTGVTGETAPAAGDLNTSFKAHQQTLSASEIRTHISRLDRTAYGYRANEDEKKLAVAALTKIDTPEVNKALVNFVISIPLDYTHKLTAAEIGAVNIILERESAKELLLKERLIAKMGSISPILKQIIARDPDLFWKLANQEDIRSFFNHPHETRNFINAIEHDCKTSGRSLSLKEVGYLNKILIEGIKDLERRKISEDEQRIPDEASELAAKMLINAVKTAPAEIRANATEVLIQDLARPLSISRGRYIGSVAEIKDPRVQEIISEIADNFNDPNSYVTATSLGYNARYIATMNGWWPTKLERENSASLNGKAFALYIQMNNGQRTSQNELKMCMTIIECASDIKNDPIITKSTIFYATEALKGAASSSKVEYAATARDLLKRAVQLKMIEDPAIINFLACFKDSDQSIAPFLRQIANYSGHPLRTTAITALTDKSATA